MSELKVGDVVYIKGDKAVIKKITKSDSDSEPLLEVAITSTRLGYLSPSALDLYAIDELNKDQKIVLEWVKENSDKGDALHPFEILAEHASDGLLEAEPAEAYCFIEGDAMLMAQVLQVFTEWWLSENE